MKKYRSISEKIIENLPIINDWLDNEFIEKISSLIGIKLLKIFIQLK